MQWLINCNLSKWTFKDPAWTIYFLEDSKGGLHASKTFLVTGYNRLSTYSEVVVEQRVSSIRCVTSSFRADRIRDEIVCFQDPWLAVEAFSED